MMWLQVVDDMAHRGVVVSLHELSAGTMLGAIELDAERWEKFKCAGDDALAVGLGQVPPRAEGAPARFRGLPIA